MQVPYEGNEILFGCSSPPWNDNGSRLWSVAEMIFWASTNFVGMWGSVEKHIGILETLIAGNPAARGAFLSPPMRSNIATFVAGYADQNASTSPWTSVLKTQEA